MQTFSETRLLREQLTLCRQKGQKIAFVPTMGNLHNGHLTLVREAQKRADIVVVSIFVNPMQFERADDLNNYPRTLQQDLSKLEADGVNYVFTPTPALMYPHGLDKQTFVEVPEISHILEGASRPGHFRGVATIVTKLFNIVQPNVACFGEKDFQQLAVIRQMVTDLCMDIEIIGVATVREEDGLAMSSRNGLLTAEERQSAPAVARAMNQIGQQLEQGECDIDGLIEKANAQLIQAGFKPDEIFIRDARTMQPLTQASEQAVILMSAFLGKARLIDNKVVTLSR
ncbi:pantoate--beta-alanine ligase [Vibrio sp. SCSIO 43137]|uniref:pantoate--beta-alanine ligase n=1 Tax=Vibrio sp. SCSIO 43137 TaxID=3021011 RepID=UPI0023074280|nr:pantoate--beta-alanine ligase [Vibrio sp. SCSIO 43137]WCE29218.1 pantoate--beta-alanine ligase [Vibrio sp. SCSIO 43137]